MWTVCLQNHTIVDRLQFAQSFVGASTVPPFANASEIVRLGFERAF